jgi:uncharacterized membrane protein
MVKNCEKWYNTSEMENTEFITSILHAVSSLEAISIFAAGIIGYIGVSIMAYGAIKSAFHFILSTIRGTNHLPYIRIDLGKHLALGLEFLVGKDIIESIIHPSWDDLGKLAVIIALRIVITLMLSYELKEIGEELDEERRRKEAMRKQKK